MRKGLKVLIVVILATLLLTACNQVISEDMNGQTVTVKTGETFIIKLSGNPTTGYGWQLTNVDETILKQVNNPSYKPDTLMTGSGGTYTYKFTAQSAGTTTLNFSYLRSWEKNVPPYKTFTITLMVQ
jgi:inhibitor of cysteine peptidase